MARVKIEPTLNRAKALIAEPAFIKVAPMTFISPPVPRHELTLPISPVPQPRGIESFEAPRGGKLHYLPVYEVQMSRVGGQDRPALEFVHDAAGDRWGLRITLVKVPPDLLAPVAGTMTALDHEVSFSLSYRPSPDAATRRDLAFQDVQSDAATATATLWAASVTERDSIYQALTKPESEAQLTAVRQTSVAIKSPGTTPGITVLESGTTAARLARLGGIQLARGQQAEASLRRVVQVDRNLNLNLQRRDLSQVARANLLRRDTLPKPRVVVTRTRRVQQGGAKAVEFTFDVRNISAFGAALFRRRRPMAGISGKAAPRLQLEVFDPETNRTHLRTGIRVQGPPDTPRTLTFVPVNGRLPRSVVFRFIDTQRNRRVESDKVLLRKPSPAPPPAATYSVIDLTLPQPVDPAPFTFPADQHPHIYAALATMPPVAVQGGLARHRETYDGKVHSYFQDVIAPRTIFFLPDAFKIARHPGVFRTPQATVRVRTQGSDHTEAEVTLDYVIAPHVDLTRLSDAAEKIAAATGIDPSEMEFQPYLTESLNYSLSRPAANGRVTEDRPTSPLMLQEPMVDTLVLPVADFQISFDAMTGTTAIAITGEVTFDVEGWGPETRRVTLDFKDLAGAALDVDAVPSTLTDNAASISLSNAIESPIDLNDVLVMATRGGLTTPVGGTDALNTSGTRLNPGDAEPVPVTFDDLPGTGPASFEVLKSGTVDPDPDAIMNAILDRASLEYFREIVVRTVPTIFPDPEDNPPPDGIFALMVEFENGQAVVLDAATTQETVRVHFPFSDVILGHEADDGSYRYFRTIVRFDGSQTRDAVPNVSTSGTLFVTPAVNGPPVDDDPGTG